MRNKDEAALRALMERYGNELMRTAYLLVKDKHAAEEAVMDTFIQAYRKIDQLQDPDRLHGWLLRITVNRCRMKMRTWSWTRILPLPHVEKMIAEEEPGPEELLIDAWRNEKLSEALLKLDYKYREAIALFYYNGLTVAEIAEQTGSNENTVKARLARGRAKLKLMLEEQEDGNEAGARARVH
ncbi:sigma-70 family RNA polymerase sigma factor [Cohnella thailandensis]|uniref:sigma-70 family RNA polymerase sigma factor n=1 Tax=Cohnella thailandensis TaxID=557557 RepID=UPI001D286AED|nr:sigma-70 family RNA polymerase sigma factor [Cohnella thailandensis]MBP1975108.1 RNA polymerase sigma-70 factor (ECF subfamily) [Cohnella thailandensis]